MDEKNTTDANLRGEDVQNLTQILEHRFPPPKTGRAASLSLLDREAAPWWWSPSADAQPCGQSRVLDSHHLLSTEMLARSLALSAQRARARLHGFAQSMAKQRGQEYDEMLDAWDGFGLDFMPRIPKHPGNPPDATYFYKAKIEKDIQNIHIVLQYFAVLIEEILHDQQIFNCPTKTKWEEVAEILKQLVREVDVVLVALELPRRRVPRSAVPQYARGLQLREAREARDWLAARDLLNAVELLWHVFSVFAAAVAARRESQLRASNYHTCGRPAPAHSASCSSPRRDASASQVILPYATVAPVPGRPAAADFLHGLHRDPPATPFSSPATGSCQQVHFDHYFPPHASRRAPESPTCLTQMYLSFELPKSMSPPSPTHSEAPSTPAQSGILSSPSPPMRSPPHADAEPADAADSSSPGAATPACCARAPEKEQSIIVGGPPDLVSPPPRPTAPADAADSHSPGAATPACCARAPEKEQSIIVGGPPDLVSPPPRATALAETP